MSDDEFLAGLSPDEAARALRALVHAPIRREQSNRKPTWHELWEAGWVAPPYCPLPANLLRELRDAAREFGPKWWTAFSPEADDVLRALSERKPGLLQCRVTKRDGPMWRLAEPNKGDTP